MGVAVSASKENQTIEQTSSKAAGESVASIWASGTGRKVVEWATAVSAILGAILLIFGIVWGALTFVKHQADDATDQQTTELTEKMSAMESRLTTQMKALEGSVSSVKEDTKYLRTRLDAHIDKQSTK